MVQLSPSETGDNGPFANSLDRVCLCDGRRAYSSVGILARTYHWASLARDAARNQLTRNLAAADRLLIELKEETQEALTDIRRLVYELRPPALAELDLISALREQATHYTLNDLQVALHAPDILPPLPAAIEMAVYRIALEALTNVSRHAHARTCSITISLTNALNLEIMDDGCGLLEEYHIGVGITSMRERAAELGGNCVIESNHMQAGTRVYASLPLPKE